MSWRNPDARHSAWDLDSYGRAITEAMDAERCTVYLVDRARDEGVSLVGPGGLLAGLTKTVLESALEGELTEHLGYDPYEPAGYLSGNQP